MLIDNKNIANILKSKSLKVTPQRLLVLKAIINSKNHPTAENIITYVKKFNPNIGIGTIYKVLDTLVKNKIIQKVETYNDVMRYEFHTKNHHHIYFSDKDLLLDYYDNNLDSILNNYFKKKKIPKLNIESIKVHITGKQKLK
ncbi:MAG: transcriptional repressor [Ignavibacteria bacterium]|nr:transcriptional repressor [Ignavibacteria bacterium]